MTPATELRAKLVALLNEMAGEPLTADQIAYRLQCGKASAKHTAESLVTSGAARDMAVAQAVKTRCLEVLRMMRPSAHSVGLGSPDFQISGIDLAAIIAGVK